MTDAGYEEMSQAEILTGSVGWQRSLPANIKFRDKPMRDISDLAVWTLSSCKPGYGVHELLNDSVDKYWQSDGPQPHTVTVEFQRKTDVSFLFLYLDYKNDESYTPSKIVVKTGSSLQTLENTVSVTFHEPSGWQRIDLRDSNIDPARVMVVHLQVVQNHQNGRDTHIRHIRVTGPSTSRFCAEARLIAGDPIRDFKTENFDMKQIMLSAMSIR
ncbi:unnamed protein product [Caenorhabditis auriculariae]|uniref:Anaphase-promoting complex subunit 10 n=1 Tax=Caenorhabditis auriculariae TaxID=2777116 RepID=A0A8S1HSL3_9PELO|nr:unnamed protein product [Caenorhabditis auriculariae]